MASHQTLKVIRRDRSVAERGRYVRPLDSVGHGDVALAGGKNAALGEMQRQLSAAGVATPAGFVLTADAYRDALTAANAWPKLHGLLDDLDVQDVAELGRRAACRSGVGLCSHGLRAAGRTDPARLCRVPARARRCRPGGKELGHRRGPAGRRVSPGSTTAT